MNVVTERIIELGMLVFTFGGWQLDVFYFSPPSISSTTSSAGSLTQAFTNMSR
ncbi:hypothetical protein M2310_003187 [Rhizobium leguminosarum]|uniref:Uncharacterized protein n=1 Tax=Rhizobium esperanzae TaxID=1967781 RepID=A0A7W6XW02_9HYPH|nr:hypothetical protein [Rhizobium esperanzae]MDH6202506.1 hypothetical protein [Rhizobium leguminosarum]